MQHSVINLSKTITTPNFRLDAEFYRYFYLESEQLISSKDNDYLGNLITTLTDYHANGSYEILRGNVEILDSPDYALMIRTVDFERDDFENDVKYVSEHAYNFLKKTKVFGGEIIVNKIGNAGKVYLVPPLDKKITLGMNQFMLRPKDSLNNYFLYVFLVCKYGHLLLEQRITGAVPLSIDKESVRSVPVPILKDEFQKIIKKLVEKYFALSNQGKGLYYQAERLLLSELGLLDWKPKHKLAFVKNFSDAKQTDRFDAEYFQPKYEEIVEAVKKYKGGFDELGNLVKIKDKNFTPKDNEQYKYIELANISSNGEINGYTENFGNELPSRARRKVQKGDLIVSSIEGSLESIALITEDWKNALCSTGFFAVNSDKINSETLLVLLKTKVGQLQLKKGCKGTILTAIGKDELSKIVLPEIKSKTQEEVRKKITKMYETKKLLKSLLEIAKRGVEMAIEKDEQEAEKWIDGELTKLEIKL